MASSPFSIAVMQGFNYAPYRQEINIDTDNIVVAVVGGVVFIECLLLPLPPCAVAFCLGSSLRARA